MSGGCSGGQGIGACVHVFLRVLLAVYDAQGHKRTYRTCLGHGVCRWAVRCASSNDGWRSNCLYVDWTTLLHAHPHPHVRSASDPSILVRSFPRASLPFPILIPLRRDGNIKGSGGEHHVRRLV